MNRQTLTKALVGVITAAAMLPTTTLAEGTMDMPAQGANMPMMGQTQGAMPPMQPPMGQMPMMGRGPGEMPMGEPGEGEAPTDPNTGEPSDNPRMRPTDPG